VSAPRTDLPYLRRRTLRAQAPPAPKVDVVHHTPPTPAVSASLDLSTPPPAPARKKPAPALVATLPVRRLTGSEVLSPKQPTVRLTRVQSGVGALTVEAACSDAVGDLRLGVAFRLKAGTSSVVQQGAPDGPARSPRPVLHHGRQRFETVTVDLAQITDVDRLAFYAYSPSGAALAWGGTLVVTTYGGARVELPMDGPAGPGVVVLLTAYNVDGELVLRAEPWELHPTVRDAVLAFGFDRITWLDPGTPAT
jgi:hypothetical protein